MAETQENAGTSTILTVAEIDAIGEILNISMGSAATAISTMLDKQVVITTPNVEVQKFHDVGYAELEPAIMVSIEYIDGISGSNVMVFRQSDMQVIINLLMGIETSPSPDFVFDEMSMSAACEVMNQMMGASATALSSFLGKTINISTPEATLMDKEHTFEQTVGLRAQEEIVSITFELNISNIMKSEFISVMTCDLAKDLVSQLMLDDPEPVPIPAAPPTPQAAPTPQAPYPSAPAQPPYPGAPAQPPYPGAPAQPPYPGAPAQAQYPGAPAQPQYPGAPAQPQYPGAPAQPQYPGAPPQGYPPYPPMPGYPPEWSSCPPGMSPYYGYPPYGYPTPSAPEKPSGIIKQGESVSVHSPKFPNFQGQPAFVVPLATSNMNLMMNVPLNVSVEIGKTKKKIRDIMEFGQGTVIELEKQAGAPVDIVVNGQLIARGDVVVVDDNFGVRITEIIGTKELVETLENNIQ